MISKKTFIADGSTNRFLSEFIIRSENYARPYVYIYDNTLLADGTEDVLQDGTTDQANWSYPDNIWRRGANLAQSNDLTTADKWQVVDNSILYYTPPKAGTTVWVEVATTTEEFGESLVQPSVERAETAAANAKISEDNAKASETASKSSEDAALLYRTQASDSASSANTYRNEAATSASEAAASNSSAYIYKNDAQTAEAGASDSAAAALTSENNAKTSEINAATSETNAKTSETNSKTSETNAKTSETNAATSETNADTSYQNSLAVEANITTNGDTQVTRVLDEGDTQDSRIITEGNTQVSNVHTQGSLEIVRVIDEGDDQVYRVATEGTTQVGNVTDEGNTQMTRLTEYVPEGVSYSVDTIDKQQALQDESNYSAYGLTKRVPKADRWMETDTPYVIVDKVSEPARFSDGLVERAVNVVVNGDFSDGSTGWSVNSNWSIINGQAVSDGTVSGGKIYKNIGIIGGIFEIEYEVLEITLNTGNGVQLLLHDEDNYITGNLTSTVGIHKECLSGTSLNGYIYIQTSGDTTCKIDNISVKELQQVTLPLAPFAPTSTDELLDYSVNGVTTQINHNAGDIVHVGNGQELVTNGTFEDVADGEDGYDNGDGTVDGWVNRDSDNNATSIIDSSLVVENIIGYNWASYHIDSIVAQEYNIKALIKSSNGLGSMFIGPLPGTSDIYRIDNITELESSIIVKATSSSMYITIKNNYGAADNSTASIDNISVTPIETTYQAITATTAGDLTTDTTKFQEIDYITSKDPILLTKTGFKTFRGYHNFAPQASVDDVASAYTYSKLGKGLFHDGLEEVVISGLDTRLNAGAYHFVYNPLGTKLFSDGNKWYNTSVSVTSKYDCMNSANCLTESGYVSSGVSGHPDAKYYDTAYYEADGGLIFKGTYATKESRHDLLDEEDSKQVRGEIDLAEQCGVELTVLPTAPYKSFLDYIADGTVRYNNELLTQGKALANDVIGDPNPYVSTDADYQSDNTSADLTDQVTLVWDTEQMYKFIAGADETAVDLTAQDFTDTTRWAKVYKGYPTDWLEYLDKGKSLPFNPLLVGQDGANYLISGVLNAILSQKNLELDGGNICLQSTDGFVTLAEISRITDAINNTVDAFNSSTRYYIWQYQAQNTPLTQTTPLPILQVLPKATSSNSFSIYKGAMVTNAITGKVAVGNGTNGLESRMLENAETGSYNILVPNVEILLENNKEYTIRAKDFSDVAKDGVYKYISTTFTATPLSTWNIDSSLTWDRVREGTKYIGTTPSHNTITLDTEVSPSAKWFSALVKFDNDELGYAVFGEDTSTDKTATTFSDLSKMYVKRLGVYDYDI